MLYWSYLAGAIVFEVFGTLALKYSALNNSALAGWLVALFYLLSFGLLWFAIKKIDISIAYAIWAGMGTAVITLVGAYLFKEQLGLFKMLFIGLIVIGVAGLKYVSEQ
jgi:small multidrug resistance pump